MAEPLLSVRSAKARDLAQRLARRENRSIADVVSARWNPMRSGKQVVSRHRRSTLVLLALMLPKSILRQ